jgi:hypothetical protein
LGTARRQGGQEAWKRRKGRRERAERVPCAEGEAQGTEDRGEHAETAPDDTAAERVAEDGREGGHRDGRSRSEEHERGRPLEPVVDRGEEEDTHGRRPAHAMHEADRVCLGWRARHQVLVVVVLIRVLVPVQVAVNGIAVHMLVDMEQPPPPAPEKPEGKRHDHEPD